MVDAVGLDLQHDRIADLVGQRERRVDALGQIRRPAPGCRSTAATPCWPTPRRRQLPAAGRSASARARRAASTVMLPRSVALFPPPARVPAGVADGARRVPRAGEVDQPVRGQCVGHLVGDVGQGVDDGDRLVGPRPGVGHAGDHLVPAGRVQRPGVARRVADAGDDVDPRRRGQQRGDVAVYLAIAPTGRGDVERVERIGERRQDAAQFLARLRSQVGQLDPTGGGHIRDQPALPAGTGEDAQPRPGRTPVGGEQLGGLHQLFEVIDAEHAVLREERIVELIRAGQRAGVRHRRAAGLLRPAELEGDDRDVPRGRLGRDAAELRDIGEPLDHCGDDADAGFGEIEAHHIDGVDDGLIAGRHRVGELQATAGGHQRQRHIAALGDQPDRAGFAPRPDGDGPQGRAAEVAHHPEAVRPDQWEALAAERAQLGLQRLAIFARLREAAAERDPTLRPGGDGLPDNPRHRPRRDRDGDRVDRLGDRADLRVGPETGDRVVVRVDRVDRPGEAERRERGDDPEPVATLRRRADDGDRAGIEERVERVRRRVIPGQTRPVGRARSVFPPRCDRWPWAQRPWKLAARRSSVAARPSFASSVRPQISPARRSLRSASSMVREAFRRMFSFARPIAIVGPCASRSASASAVGIS